MSTLFWDKLGHHVLVTATSRGPAAVARWFKRSQLNITVYHGYYTIALTPKTYNAINKFNFRSFSLKCKRLTSDFAPSTSGSTPNPRVSTKLDDSFATRTWAEPWTVIIALPCRTALCTLYTLKQHRIVGYDEGQRRKCGLIVAFFGSALPRGSPGSTGKMQFSFP